MDSYLLVLFGDVVAGVALLSALGIEAVGFERTMTATTMEARRSWLVLQRSAVRSEAIAMPVAVVAGVWMMAARWGPDPWTPLALIAIALMAVLTGVVTRRGLGRLAATHDVREAGSRLRLSLWSRIGLGVAILALMTTKPDLVVSAAIVVIAVAIGPVVEAVSRTRSGAGSEVPSASHG